MGLPRLVVSAGKPSADGKYHPRFSSGNAPYVGVNALDGTNYFTLENSWLNLLKNAGNNYEYLGHPWGTLNSAGTDTGEEAYLASVLDSDGYPTSLTVTGIPGGQQFTQLDCGVYSNRLVTTPLPPGATDTNPALALRFRFQGKCTLQIVVLGTLSAVTSNTAGVTVSGVSDSQATITSVNAWGTTNEVTFGISSSVGFLRFYVLAVPDEANRFTAATLVETQYASLFDGGQIVHPLYKAAFTDYGAGGFRRLRCMAGLQTNSQEIRLNFTAGLASGNNTGGTLSDIWQAQSHWTVWPFASGTRNVLFATGQVIACAFTYNSPAVTWGTALSGAIADTGDAAAAPFAMAFAAMKGSGWAGRPLLSNLSWSSSAGIPLEAFLQACNELGAEPWANIPAIDHVIDSTYSVNVAKLCHDGTGANITGSNLTGFTGVAPGNRTFVEFSNETWNFGVPYRHGNLLCNMMGVLKGYYAAQGNGQIQGGQEYYGTQCGAIGDAFFSVYGAQMATRVLVGVMSQAVVGTLTALAMNTPDAVDAAYTHHIGMVGFAPYIGPASASAGPNLTTAEIAIIVACTDPLTELFSLAYSNIGSVTGHAYGIPSTGWAGGMIVQTQAIIANWASQPWKNLPIHCYEGGTGANNALSNFAAASSLSWLGGIVTVNTASALANLSTGNTFETAISGVTPSGYNTPFAQTVTATVTGASSFTFPLATNPGTETAVGGFTPYPYYEWSNLLVSALRDQRMSYIYFDPNGVFSNNLGYCQQLINLGVSFNQLNFIDPPPDGAHSPWGGWGALEIVTQMEGIPPLSAAPKYEGLINFAQNVRGAKALVGTLADPTIAVGSLATGIKLAGAVSDASAATGALTTGPAPQPPVILYTDIVSGSATNNEFGAGAYLRIYLLNPGTWANVGTASGAQVTIGGQPIANYRYLQPAPTNGVRPGAPNTWCLCVQVGSAAVQALTPGTAYQIGVTVNGLTANTVDTVGNPLTFTIQLGHFYHVNTVSGNDSTGVVDDPTHPYRYIQAWTGSAFTGLWTVLKPGDTIVPHGNGGTPITDQNGFDTRLMRFSQHAPVGGTAPTGTIGAGWIHVTAFPGAVNGNAPDDVYILTPNGGEGGFMGAAENYTRPNSPNAGQYWSVSAMRTSCTGSLGSNDASNFNLQNSADFTRFVGNNISWPSTDTGAAHQKCGGIVGNGYHSWWLGNYVHDISGGDPSSLENHGLYADGSNTDAAWIEIGFNVIVNCTTGQCIQFHQEASTGFHDCYIHHNWCENSAKYGMKMDGWSGIMRWWNNVVVGSNREAFQIDATGATAAGNVAFENNTLYDGYSSSSGAYLAQIANEGGNAPGTFTIRNNIIAFSASSSGFSSTWISGQTIGTISGNLYYDYSGRLTSKYSGDAAGLYGNPQFSNPATFPNSDLRIGPTSAALGRAIAATINPTNDLGMNVQPRAGQSVASVGAFA